MTCQPPPPTDCQQCGPGYGGKGKVYYIKVTYNGMTAEETGEWDSKKDGYKSLKANTTLIFGDGTRVEVHTSCSKPLYIGMTVPVYNGNCKKKCDPIGYATVTGLIVSPCVPDPPSGGGGCGWCSKCKK